MNFEGYRLDLGVRLSTVASGFIYHPRQLLRNLSNVKPEICATTYSALAFSGTLQAPAWGSVVNPLSGVVSNERRTPSGVCRWFVFIA